MPSQIVGRSAPVMSVPSSRQERIELEVHGRPAPTTPYSSNNNKKMMIKWLSLTREPKLSANSKSPESDTSTSKTPHIARHSTPPIQSNTPSLCTDRLSILQPDLVSRPKYDLLSVDAPFANNPSQQHIYRRSTWPKSMVLHLPPSNTADRFVQSVGSVPGLQHLNASAEEESKSEVQDNHRFRVSNRSLFVRTGMEAISALANSTQTNLLCSFTPTSEQKMQIDNNLPIGNERDNALLSIAQNDDQNTHVIVELDHRSPYITQFPPEHRLPFQQSHLKGSALGNLSPIMMKLHINGDIPLSNPIESDMMGCEINVTEEENNGVGHDSMLFPNLLDKGERESPERLAALSINDVSPIHSLSSVNPPTVDPLSSTHFSQFPRKEQLGPKQSPTNDRSDDKSRNLSQKLSPCLSPVSSWFSPNNRHSSLFSFSSWAKSNTKRFSGNAVRPEDDRNAWGFDDDVIAVSEAKEEKKQDLETKIHLDLISKANQNKTCRGSLTHRQHISDVKNEQWVVQRRREFAMKLEQRGRQEQEEKDRLRKQKLLRRRSAPPVMPLFGHWSLPGQASVYIDPFPNRSFFFLECSETDCQDQFCYKHHCAATEPEKRSSDLTIASGEKEMTLSSALPIETNPPILQMAANPTRIPNDGSGLIAVSPFSLAPAYSKAIDRIQEASDITSSIAV